MRLAPHPINRMFSVSKIFALELSLGIPHLQ